MLTGLAGLAAGAFSMAAGEYVSVSSQNELVEAEVSKERYELEHNPDDRAQRAGRHVRPARRGRRTWPTRWPGRSPRTRIALRVHVREELGVDHEDLPSPYVAAGASLLTFAVGALIPLLPYLAGLGSLAASLVLAAVAALRRRRRWWPGSPTGRSCAARSASSCWPPRRPR